LRNDIPAGSMRARSLFGVEHETEPSLISSVHLLVSLIVAVSIVLMLIRPRNIPEVYWIGSGVLLLLILRLVPVELAVHLVAQAMDVCLFLAGMMLLSELAREHGVVDWLSAITVRNAKGSCARLFCAGVYRWHAGHGLHVE
jgi:arsenical pump membrane protein